MILNRMKWKGERERIIVWFENHSFWGHLFSLAYILVARTTVRRTEERKTHFIDYTHIDVYMHDSASVHLCTIGIDGSGWASSKHCFRQRWQPIMIMQVPNNWFTLLQDAQLHTCVYWHHTLYEMDHDRVNLAMQLNPKRSTHMQFFYI